MNYEWPIFSVTDNNFPEIALDMFRFQYETNPVYHSYVDAICVKPALVDAIEKIPFLPISFFKTDEIKTGKFNAERIFESSGTTKTINSRHHIKKTSLYIESFTKGFKNIYGEPGEWCILG